MARIVAKHRYQMNFCNSFNGQYFNLYVRRFFFGLVYSKMLQHNNERYLCFDMGTSEFLINKMMLNVYPHSAKVQHTCFTAQYQRGQSRDTHVVISHVLFTFCA